MKDLEQKILKGLDACAIPLNQGCEGCPYYEKNTECVSALMDDCLKFLTAKKNVSINT